MVIKMVNNVPLQLKSIQGIYIFNELDEIKNLKLIIIFYTNNDRYDISK